MKIKHILLVIFVAFLLPLTLNAEVLFSDDFEWGADWNSGQANAEAIASAHGWGSVAVGMQNRGGSYEAAYINSAGAKQGSRGFIQYWDKTTEYAYAQDIWLKSYPVFNFFPDEYYIGYWFKVDPEWGWAGDSNSLKIIKTNFGDGGSTTWDIVWKHIYSPYCGDTWCYVDSNNWTGDAGCDASIQVGPDAGSMMLGCWSAMMDGEWHCFIWHMKHSTGVLTLSIDGEDALQMKSASAPGAIYQAGVGSVRWEFGGNITNGGGTKAEQWTAYDDLIIATTRTEVEDFLGVSGATPAPPTLSNVTISNGRVQ